MKKDYDEMMAKHRRLCNEVHSCGECVFNKANGLDRGGCFAKWMHEVLVDGRDEDLPLDEEF